MSARIIKEKAWVVAMDMRGHGKSSIENDLDLFVEALIIVGGSVAVHVAAKKTLRSLAGLVVVDVVEGTAVASLIHMRKILSSRMQHFSSIEKEIEWSVKGSSLRNIDSARTSIPSTLKFDESKNRYVYGSQLEETEQYWKGWYESLSEKFLSSPVPKLLLLAGTDKLDRKMHLMNLLH